MFQTLLQRWHHLWRLRGASKFESAEAALAREIEAADRGDPNWDSDARASTAAHMIERGTSPELIKSAYGNEIFSAALALLPPGELVQLVRNNTAALFGPELDRLSERRKIVAAANMLRLRSADVLQVKQDYNSDTILAALSLLEPDRVTPIIQLLAAEFYSNHLETDAKVPYVSAAADLLAQGVAPQVVRRAFSSDIFLCALRGVGPADMLFVIRSAFDPRWADGYDSACGLFVNETTTPGEQEKVLESLELLKREIAPEIVERAYGHPTYSTALNLLQGDRPWVTRHGVTAA
jgi:hypothetical protein